MVGPTFFKYKWERISYCMLRFFHKTRIADSENGVIMAILSNTVVNLASSPVGIVSSKDVSVQKNIRQLSLKYGLSI